jgi:hypothetical protein
MEFETRAAVGDFQGLVPVIVIKRVIGGFLTVWGHTDTNQHGVVGDFFWDYLRGKRDQYGRMKSR